MQAIMEQVRTSLEDSVKAQMEQLANNTQESLTSQCGVLGNALNRQLDTHQNALAAQTDHINKFREQVDQHQNISELQNAMASRRFFRRLDH